MNLKVFFFQGTDDWQIFFFYQLQTSRVWLKYFINIRIIQKVSRILLLAIFKQKSVFLILPPTVNVDWKKFNFESVGSIWLLSVFSPINRVNKSSS